MSQYCFGYMLKEYRTRLGVSQEDLCDGICDVSTLSKIESGKRTPHRPLAIALMNKLGIPESLFNIPVTRSELRRAEIETMLKESVAKKNYDILELLEEYKACDKEMDVIEQQTYSYYTFFLECKHYTLDQKKDILLISLRLTFPSFTLENSLSNHLLTIQEIKIINSLADVLFRKGETDLGLNLLIALEENISSKRIQISEFDTHYANILGNISLLFGLADNFEKSLEYCNKGIAFCQKTDIYYNLPNFIFYKGFNLLKLGNDIEGTQEIIKSLIILKAYNKLSLYNIMKNDIISSFGLEFWKNIEKKL